jgi:ABC-2 type transport system ATP-binding protein
MSSIIQVQNVSFSYKAPKKALDGISFEVNQNQTVGLLGPNGGGKSTLFKIISSLIRTYEGEVIIDGLGQKKNLAATLAKLGVVFQSPSLDKKLTVQENLLYQANLYGFSNQSIKPRMEMLLETLSVSDRRNDLVGDLSGGLARRVEIVKSLLHSPSILLLDEPSTGLDIAVRSELWKMLKQIQQNQNLTILLTTHFVEEANSCDQIVLLNEGKIVSSGTPERLKQELSFKSFNVKPKNISAAEELLKQKFQITAQKENGYLQFKAAPDLAKAIANELAFEVEELTYRDPTLEDVFIHHTGRGVHESKGNA